MGNLDSRVNQVKCLRNSKGNQVVRSILSLQGDILCVRLACFLQARAQTGQSKRPRSEWRGWRTYGGSVAKPYAVGLVSTNTGDVVQQPIHGASRERQSGLQ